MVNIQAKKHLGQNFLNNPDILRKIVGSSSLQGSHIVEVGPGPGDLTEAILQENPLSLSLIELDSDMIPLLKSRFHRQDIHIYRSDVLAINISKGGLEDSSSGVKIYEDIKNITFPSYEVYGNIPYYITSPIIHHFFYGVSLLPRKATFTMQKEVADRILARNEKHSVLSISCHLVSNIEKVCDINPNSFIPVPKVWSTCLAFTLKDGISRENNIRTMKIVERGFSQKRKKLITNLQSLYKKDILEKVFLSIGLSETVRAEELSPDQWSQMSDKIYAA